MARATFGTHVLGPGMSGTKLPARRKLLDEESNRESLVGFLPDHLAMRVRPEKLDKRLAVGKKIDALAGGDPQTRWATTVFAPDNRYTFSDTAFPWDTAGQHIYWQQQVNGPTIDGTEARNDYVVVVLDRRMGDLTGWMGSRTYDDGWDGGSYWSHIGFGRAVAARGRGPELAERLEQRGERPLEHGRPDHSRPQRVPLGGRRSAFSRMWFQTAGLTS